MIRLGTIRYLQIHLDTQRNSTYSCLQGGELGDVPVWYHTACFINYYKHTLKTELHAEESDISLSLPQPQPQPQPNPHLTRTLT